MASASGFLVARSSDGTGEARALSAKVRRTATESLNCILAGGSWLVLLEWGVMRLMRIDVLDETLLGQIGVVFISSFRSTYWL